MLKEDLCRKDYSLRGSVRKGWRRESPFPSLFNACHAHRLEGLLQINFEVNDKPRLEITRDFFNLNMTHE